MKMTKFFRMLSGIVCCVLIAAMALLTTGCSDSKTTSQPDSSQKVSVQSEAKILGTGATEFDFTVIDLKGKETAFKIKTDKKIVGDALSEVGLISGDEGPYGLYVKTVNGTTLDYDTDGKYWAFYVDGKYGSTAVDTTEIESGKIYSFKAE